MYSKYHGYYHKKKRVLDYPVYEGMTPRIVKGHVLEARISAQWGTSGNSLCLLKLLIRKVLGLYFSSRSM